MTWTVEEQRTVGRALLGSWPGTITAWGKDAFAAYIGELEARGLGAERVLLAIRSWQSGSDFPPSAPNLAAAARMDPSAPTFEEAYQLLRQVLRARAPYTGPIVLKSGEPHPDDIAKIERARSMHPLIGEFVDRFGLARLKGLELDHPQFGEKVRRELEAKWSGMVASLDDRDVAALAVSGRRGGLGRLDPLAVLGGGSAGELEAGE